MKEAKEYFKAYKSSACSVPIFERVKHLWIMGHTAASIASMINKEFSDITSRQFGPDDIRLMVDNNKEQLKESRLALSRACRDEMIEQTARMFEIVRREEDLMVKVFAGKLKEALESLMDLDLEERDDDGNYKNTSRIFVLTEMAIKLQSHIAKIVGTDALREIEVFAAKAKAKRESESASTLLPKGDAVDVETNWL